MSPRRTFGRDFKCQIVKEYLSGVLTVGQSSRRWEVYPHLIYRWKKQYANGAMFGGKDSGSAALKMRVFGQLVGELVLRNKRLTRASSYTQRKRRGNSSIITSPLFDRSEGGAA